MQSNDNKNFNPTNSDSFQSLIKWEDIVELVSFCG